MDTIKTDNSYLKAKVDLRLSSLPNKKTISVLECFAGEGKIWDEVMQRSSKKITVLRIEKENKGKVNLRGDNMKFLPSMDLSKFDIVDLDAYGSPFKQLEIVFQKRFSGVVHCTFIQSMMGKLDKSMLVELGYSDKMIKKIPSLFNKNGLQKMLQYLGNRGVKNVSGIFIDRKNYFYFNLDK